MSNIISYAQKIKHLSFEEEPFTIVDSLIFSQLAYMSYDGFIGSYEDNKPPRYFKELLHYKDNDFMFHGIIMEKETRELFGVIVDSKRYGNLRMNYYVNTVNEQEIEQFCAITLFVENLFTYIAYRGTDVSITGWKEDFYMTFQSPVPAQIAAKRYVDVIGHLTHGDIYVSGHSKGGNLAVYAAMYAMPEIQKKIVKVFNHDGPGFQKEVLQSKEYVQIKDKLISVLPHSSVVGMLLEQDEDFMVVKSHRFWIMQHDPFSWIVEEKDFLRTNSLSSGAQLFSESLNEWLNNIDHDKREVFIDTLFQVIEATGEKDFEKLSVHKVKNAQAILKAMKDIDPEVKQFCMKAFTSLLSHILLRVGKEEMKEVKTLIDGQIHHLFQHKKSVDELL